MGGQVAQQVVDLCGLKTVHQQTHPHTTGSSVTQFAQQRAAGQACDGATWPRQCGAGAQQGGQQRAEQGAQHGGQGATLGSRIQGLLACWPVWAGCSLAASKLAC